jgi:hypothetical protein
MGIYAEITAPHNLLDIALCRHGKITDLSRELRVMILKNETAETASRRQMVPPKPAIPYNLH